MNLAKNNLIIGTLIFIAYITVGIFGLTQLSHMDDTPMINCPYSENGYSVCANSLIHINDWREFSSVIFPTLLMLSLLVSGLILYFFDKRKFFKETSRIFYWYKYYLDNKKLYTPKKKITKWLSLLLNSPSFSY